MATSFQVVRDQSRSVNDGGADRECGVRVDEFADASLPSLPPSSLSFNVARNALILLEPTSFEGSAGRPRNL